MAHSQPTLAGLCKWFQKTGSLATLLSLFVGASSPSISFGEEEVETSTEVPVSPPTQLRANLLTGPPVLRRVSNLRGEANASITDSEIGKPDESSHPRLDRIWSWPILYRNPENSYLQEISLFGRHQTQFYSVDSAQGSVNGTEARRAKFGVRAIFLQNFTLASSYNIAVDSAERGLNIIDKRELDTLTLAWKPSDDLQVVLGQQKPGFMYEYDTSSNSILTFERSLIVNQLAPDKSPGLSVEGKLKDVFYQIGGYSGNELGDPLGNGFAIVKLGYDFSELSRYEKANAQFYYLHNSSALGTGAAPYRHAVSLSAAVQEGRFSGLAQTVFADGYGLTSDAWGLTIMPSFYLREDKLQLVARYQYANSSDPDGLQAQSRYEQDVPFISDGGAGDKYQAGYLGLNWYLYGRELKVMNGVEYSKLRGGINGGDFSGWTLFSGLRLHF